MDMTDHLAKVTTQKLHSNYSIFKRIANLTLVIVAAAICVNLWLLNTGQSKQWHDKQSTQLGRSLAAYAANVLAPSVQQNDTDSIASQLTILANDPHVLGVSIYDQKGTVLDSNEQNVSVLATFLLGEQPPLVFIEEIKYQQKVLGYLRLMLDEEQVMTFHSDYQLQLYKQIIVLMLLAGLLGILIARSYYKIKFRHFERPAKHR